MTKQVITLAMGSVLDDWKSSELYLQRLISALSEIDSEFQFQAWKSETGGVAMLRRRVIVPKEIGKDVHNAVHLLDQSYGDSLLGIEQPKVATVADINFWHQRGWNPLRILLRYRIVEGLRSANHLVAISETTKNELIEHLGFDSKRISVIPFSIDAQFLEIAESIPDSLADKVDTPFLLHVGSCDPRKGLETLFRTMAMDTSLPRLVQVGGKPSSRLLSLVDTLNLNHRVDFLGSLDTKIIHSLYSRCIAFIFPSHYEGFGVPPLEAVASGAKIITTRMPSVTEVLGADPVLDHMEDLETWAGKINVVIKEPAPQFPGSVKERENWTWRVAAQKYLEIYRKYLAIT